MQSKCSECQRANLECEVEQGCSCNNCAERGYADICLGGTVNSEPVPLPTSSTLVCTKSSKNFIFSRLARYIRAFLVKFTSTFIGVYTSHRTVSCLQFFYLPVLLFFPSYYSSQAAGVLEMAESCKAEYDEWIEVLKIRLVNLDAAITSSSPTLSDGGIELQPLPSTSSASSSERDRGRATLESIRVPPYSSVQTLSESSPLVRFPPPESVVRLKDSWRRYIEGRDMEWRILITIAFVLVAASPTIFQIPGASDDPITRSIAFLALSKAISGVIFGPIFPIYFKGSHTRTAHYAMLWAEEVKKSENSVFRNHWIMLSLPAVATSWATVFFLLSFFAFIWRTGSTADPSDWPDSTQGRPPIPFDLALVLRIIITSITVIDLMLTAWIWRTLRRYSNNVWRDENGDALPPTPGSEGHHGTRFNNLTP